MLKNSKLLEYDFVAEPGFSNANMITIEEQRRKEFEKKQKLRLKKLKIILEDDNKDR